MKDDNHIHWGMWVVMIVWLIVLTCGHFLQQDLMQQMLDLTGEILETIKMISRN